MAKTLSERLATASACTSNRISTADLEQLIADATAERDAQAAQHVSYRADALNFKLAEEDRDEAARNAERAERNAAALAAELVDLEAKLQARRESDKTAQAAAQRKAAIAERDALAERIAAEWPALSEGMIALFDAIQANEQRLKAAGLYEADAEATARGIPGNWYVANVPVKRFTAMKIPDWTGKQLAWPRPAVPFDMRAAVQAQADRVKAEADANAPRYMWHVARVSNGVANPFFGKHRDDRISVGQISNGETNIQITEREAARLNTIPGIKVAKLAKEPPVPPTFFVHPAA